MEKGTFTGWFWTWFLVWLLAVIILLCVGAGVRAVAANGAPDAARAIASHATEVSWAATGTVIRSAFSIETDTPFQCCFPDRSPV
jgi:hypothetical protein